MQRLCHKHPSNIPCEAVSSNPWKTGIQQQLALKLPQKLNYAGFPSPYRDQPHSGTVPGLMIRRHLQMLLQAPNHARFMRELWLVAAALLLLPPEVLSADEWPDGIVDRATQVDVFEDRIKVEMSVGMSDPTVEQSLRELKGTEFTLADSIESRLDQLREASLQHLAEQLKLKINGEPVSWTSLKSEVSSQHHIRFFVYLEAPIDVNTSELSIEIRDNTFSWLRNQLRPALRPRGVKLTRSNVPPMVIRSERVYVSELPKDDQQLATRIYAVMQSTAADEEAVSSRSELQQESSKPVRQPSETADAPVDQAPQPQDDDDDSETITSGDEPESNQEAETTEEPENQFPMFILLLFGGLVMYIVFRRLARA